jgi:hypothetical protein
MSVLLAQNGRRPRHLFSERYLSEAIPCNHQPNLVEEWEVFFHVLRVGEGNLLLFLLVMNRFDWMTM